MSSPRGEIGRFRFRPRYRLFALGAVLMGLSLLVYAIVARENTALTAAMGLAGITLGLLYLASPVWRFEVVIHEDHLEVVNRDTLRFRLPWSNVEQLIASPTTRTCFVRGDSPDHSILIPGPGANASYDIEDKQRLFELIMAHVPPDRVREVESLAAWKKAQRALPVQPIDPDQPARPDGISDPGADPPDSHATDEPGEDASSEADTP